MTCRKVASLIGIVRFVLAATAAVGCLVASTGAIAAPVTYTMFAVTDVSLGGRHFHKAQVYLKFVGNTDDILQLNPDVTADGVSGYKIVKGKASLLIINGKLRVKANFLPDQLLVSLDTTNGGGGFSSQLGAAHHLEPAYPLALDASTISSAPDLATPGAYSGHAWSCIGFPVDPDPPVGGSGQCSDPANFPLKTDRGDFFIYQPYLVLDPLDGKIHDDYSGTLNNGIFSVVVGARD